MADEAAEVFRSVFQLADGFTLNPSMTFGDVPGWDSLGHMNLVTALETRLDVSLEMDEIVGLDSVGAVAELIAAKTSL